MDMGIKIPWVGALRVEGVRYAMGWWEVKIPWVGGSIYHRYDIS
jgi:hypothetical protein